ncbi:AAA-like domain-containing protein [Promineifilum sp.]|uniref:AAA-like domain-containing protein n=1 Tax=Promineifilum sp. TaxID=2664178 RepID=UPI0035AF0F0D
MASSSGFLPLRHRIRLRDQLVSYFSRAELQTLCYDLGIPFDDLAGETLTNKVEDLIGRLERSGQVAQLIAYCQRERSQVVWTDQARLFLSYKRHAETDSQLAHQWQERLGAAGHEVFIDTTMRVGTAWLDQIDAAIRDSDFLIVLLSRQSQDSEMLQQEVQRAYEYGRRQGKPVILPIRINHEDMLPYSLAAFLNTQQYLLWRGDQDTDAVLTGLLAAIAGDKPAPPPLAPLPAQPAPQTIITTDGRVAEAGSFAKPPLPAFDPRVMDDMEVPGGTMRLSDKFYIEREADAQLKRQLTRRGTMSTIRAPRQTGKSSLLARGVGHAKSQKMRIVHLDLQRVDRDDFADADAFLHYFGRYIVFKLGLDVEQMKRIWSRSLGCQDLVTSLMEEYVLPELTDPVVIAIDEADRLLDTSFYSDFFGMVRSWHNSVAYEPLWEMVNFALVISTEPYLLIADPNQSPFNVGLRINLKDFTGDQVADLNRRYGYPVAAANLADFNRLLGGHPYLTRKALYTLVVDQLPWNEFIKVAASDTGPFSDHLRRQLWLLHDKPELQAALREVVQRERCSNDLLRYQLLSAGLITASGDRCEARCELYQLYFRDRL